jgi:SpoIID/LytB domain protein
MIQHRGPRFCFLKKIFGLGVVLIVATMTNSVWAFQAKIFRQQLAEWCNSGQYQYALKKINQYLQHHPRHIQAWLESAAIAQEIENYPLASSDYQQYLKQHFSVSVELELISTLRRECHFSQARFFLNQLIHRHISNIQIDYEKALVDYNEACLGTEIGQKQSKSLLESAKKNLKIFTQQNPHFALAFLKLGKVDQRLGEISNALADYSKAMGLDNNYTHLYGVMAQLLKSQKHYAGAMLFYRKDSLIHPNNKQLKHQLAEMKLKVASLVHQTKQLAEKKWMQWTPRREAQLPGSPITIRVGLETNVNKLIFRGASQLIVVSFPTQTRWVLKKNKNYEILSRSKNEYSLLNHHGKVLKTFTHKIWIVPVQAQHPILLRSIISGSGYFFAKVANRDYRGIIEVDPTPQHGFNLINRVSLEDYTAGVVSAEMPAGWPMAALEAQAILVRTDALAMLGMYRAQGFDVTDGVSCQVYGGIHAETHRSNEAVRKTAGLILVQKNKHIFFAPYSADCGGMTQSAQEVWGYRSPVIGVKDFSSRENLNFVFPLTPCELERWIKTSPKAYCNVVNVDGNSEFRWAYSLSVKRIEKKLPHLGSIKKIMIIKRSPEGWALQLKIEGTHQTQIFSGGQIRWILGNLRSNLIWIEMQDNRDHNPIQVTIYGGGWGHGVGMCQVGAYTLAKSGKTDLWILQHYFPLGKVVFSKKIPNE